MLWFSADMTCRWSYGYWSKVFTPSYLVRGTAAGDEDIGAVTSSIDLKSHC